jgi:hypothetical protein
VRGVGQGEDFRTAEAPAAFDFCYGFFVLFAEPDFEVKIVAKLHILDVSTVE